MKLVIRGMISHDLSEVRAVDAACYDRPLSLARLRKYLRFDPPNVRIGLVAECREEGEWEYQCVGYALYTVKRGRMVLDRLGVAPALRRTGVGRRLLADVQKRTLTHCVPRVLFTLPESDLAALCFARACGVRPVRVLRGKFGTEDGIAFEVPGGFQAPPELTSAGSGVGLGGESVPPKPGGPRERHPQERPGQQAVVGRDDLLLGHDLHRRQEGGRGE